MSEVRAATLSSGIWRLRSLLSGAVGVELVRWPLLVGSEAFDVVVGWGHKSSAAAARRFSERRNKSFVAIEDGWIRSINPGMSELPRSLVLDRTGIYYDASTPSDLERLIAENAADTDDEVRLRAERGIARLRGEAISKYNNGQMLDGQALGLAPRGDRKRVLVVDQTYGDMSVTSGMADAASFITMLAAARAENPGAEIVVKIHPEVVNGKKKGYLAELGAGLGDVRVVSTLVNPWSLLEAVDHVYVVTSQLGFEALMAGRPVSCFGAPFYAGWGLTDDRVSIPRRTARPTLAQMFSAAYFDYTAYTDTRSGQRISFEAALDQLVTDRAAARPSYVPIAGGRWRSFIGWRLAG
jgi:capsular polysaccharide export protein